MHTRMQKDHIHMLKILQSMSEFGRLCKQQYNPACTKSVSLHNVKLDTIQKKKKKEKNFVITLSALEALMLVQPLLPGCF